MRTEDARGNDGGDGGGGAAQSVAASRWNEARVMAEFPPLRERLLLNVALALA